MQLYMYCFLLVHQWFADALIYDAAARHLSKDTESLNLSTASYRWCSQGQIKNLHSKGELGQHLIQVYTRFLALKYMFAQ